MGTLGITRRQRRYRGPSFGRRLLNTVGGVTLILVAAPLYAASDVVDRLKVRVIKWLDNWLTYDDRDDQFKAKPTTVVEKKRLEGVVK